MEFSIKNTVEVLDLTVHDAAGESIQIRGNTHDILVENCTVYNGLGNYSGIDIYYWSTGRPHHITVKGCTAYNFTIGYPGAGIGSEQADDLSIINNTIYNSMLGIDIGSGDRNSITSNLVYSCETGIALSSNENSEVYENIVHDIDDERIYCYYWSAHLEAHAGNKWHDNTLYNIGYGIYESNVKGSSGKEGLTSNQQYYKNLFYNISRGFYFKGTTELKFYNNTVYMNSGYNAIQLVDGAVNADIRNNIISISGKNVLPVIADTSSQVGLIKDYNCYQNRKGTVIYTDANSIVEDPLFLNIGQANFHLQSASHCINAGIDLDLPFNGNKPDMGAYETAYTTGVKNNIHTWWE
jgi:parallel beta-helix repeat protein